MSIRRVAIIFDSTARPETTGVYCRRALGQLVEVEHFLPWETCGIKKGDFDLFLYIDDGLRYPIPTELRPSAFWAIDTHLDFERCWERAKVVDMVFAAQRDGAERLREGGIINSVWLPLACDPELHAKRELPKRYDVAFIGNVFVGERQELLDQIVARYPNSFVGQRYFQEMAEVYSESRIVFNCSVANDINMRVFEALASGSLLLTNDLAANGQNEFFQPTVHLVTYRTRAEVFDQIDFFLKHFEERELIAARGHAEVMAQHTYRHRMQNVLEQADRLVNYDKQLNHHLDVVSSKESGYFEFSRPEVAALVPETARHILDIGCGAGRLGAAIKDRQAAEIVGLEIDSAAADRAKQWLDDVIEANVEAADVEFAQQQFDCVICADVLEHLRNPRHVLQKIIRWLSPNGTLVASVPNVRHHSVLTSLLDGNWTYESAGLLDEDHVRFFTRREIQKLLYRVGFEIEEMQGIPGPGDQDLNTINATNVQIGGLSLTARSPADAQELLTYQFLIKCRPAVKSKYALTSIVVLTHNQLENTRLCIDSIRFRTDEPYELIVIDNASTDGTLAYLRAQSDIVLIENETNRGFPAGCNQGIEIARGRQILLLNNDTVVTTGWLRRLLDALATDQRIGIVGPYSNNVSGFQQVPVTYDDLTNLDGFAWDWSLDHVASIRDVERLIGFCFLIRRELIECIGTLDERFGIGCFEDDDYCRRARDSGYRSVIAEDVFIHHFGSRTFRALDVDFASVMDENRQYYEAKWKHRESSQARGLEHLQSETSSLALSIPRYELEQLSTPGLQLKRVALRLSLCMIVRDNERTIESCLESIRPWVDEMIIVDTGSIDRTRQIVTNFGAQLYDFPWCDDFSAARNESLRYARGEWIFWMDSDDTISPENGQQLRDLVYSHHADDIFGYILQVHCPSPNEDGVPDVTVVDHVKVFRNRDDLRFEGRIHEQILPSIRRAGGEVEFTDIFVMHSGSEHGPESFIRKLDRDLRILKLDLAERPDHPFVLFNLGMTYADARQYPEAIWHLNRSIAVSQANESHIRKAYALLVSCLFQANDPYEAFAVCRRALDMFPEDKELLFRSAMLHHRFGRLRQAETMYRRVIERPEARHFTSIDKDLAGWKARHNLALVYEEMGRIDLASAQRHLIGSSV